MHIKRIIRFIKSASVQYLNLSSYGLLRWMGERMEDYSSTLTPNRKRVCARNESWTIKKKSVSGAAGRANPALPEVVNNYRRLGSI